MRTIRLMSVLVATATLTGAALGQVRPDALQMTCTEAKLLVQSKGSVVISTGASTYTRYVSNRASCQYFERTRRAWTPTKDNKSCQIGQICVPGFRNQSDQ